jgi:alkylation response protein AidB-like acyl-CoA dehydrogenase
MSFVPDEDQTQLVQSVRRFLADRSPIAEVRRLMATSDGYDDAVWQTLAEQLGLVGLAVPAAYGGGGATFVEQALVFEEMGRALLCAPYLSTVGLAVPALLACDDPAAANELLPGIADGTTCATLAVTEDDGRWEPDTVTTTATRAAGGYVLNGAKCFVLDGHTADLLLVLARSGNGLSLFAVGADAPGLTRTPLETLDQTRKQARIVFDATPGRLVGAEGAGGEVVARALDHAAVAVAMELVGSAQRCLDMSVDYAKVRVQFGRKIGSFQAIKHKCADMLVAVESARSAAYHAAWAAVHAPDELQVAAAMAKAMASEAATFCAAENIQVHGGIGFTWEHDAHLYYRRAHSSSVLLGDPAFHRERLAALLGF